MRLHRDNKLLIEPPTAATGDIAFNLIVFFLVCASVQPDSGRKQSIPKSETKQQKQQQSENIEVALTRNANSVSVNGNPVPVAGFKTYIEKILKAKPRPEDKIVVVKSRPEVPYNHWIHVTGLIEDAGGVITLQLEEERTVVAPGP